MKLTNGKTNIKSFLKLGFASMICTAMNMAPQAYAIVRPEDEDPSRIVSEGNQSNSMKGFDNSTSTGREAIPMGVGKPSNVDIEAGLRNLSKGVERADNGKQMPAGGSKDTISGLLPPPGNPIAENSANEANKNQEARKKDIEAKREVIKGMLTGGVIAGQKLEAKQNKELVPYGGPVRQAEETSRLKAEDKAHRAELKTKHAEEAVKREEKAKRKAEARQAEKSRQARDLIPYTGPIAQPTAEEIAEKANAQQEEANLKAKIRERDAQAREDAKKELRKQKLETEIRKEVKDIEAQERDGRSDVGRDKQDVHLTNLFDQLGNLDADRSRTLRSDLNAELEAARQSGETERSKESARIHEKWKTNRDKRIEKSNQEAAAKQAEAAKQKVENRANAAERAAEQAEQRQANLQESTRNLEAGLKQMESEETALREDMQKLRGEINKLYGEIGQEKASLGKTTASKDKKAALLAKELERDALEIQLNSKEKEYNNKRREINSANREKQSIKKELVEAEQNTKVAKQAADEARRKERAAAQANTKMPAIGMPTAEESVSTKAPTTAKARGLTLYTGNPTEEDAKASAALENEVRIKRREALEVKRKELEAKRRMEKQEKVKAEQRKEEVKRLHTSDRLKRELGETAEAKEAHKKLVNEAGGKFAGSSAETEANLKNEISKLERGKYAEERDAAAKRAYEKKQADEKAARKELVNDAGGSFAGSKEEAEANLKKIDKGQYVDPKVLAAEEAARQAVQWQETAEASKRQAEADLALKKDTLRALETKRDELLNAIKKGGSQKSITNSKEVLRELEGEINRVNKEINRAKIKAANQAAAAKAASKTADIKKRKADKARRRTNAASQGAGSGPGSGQGHAQRSASTGRATQAMTPAQLQPRKPFGDRIKEIFSSKKASISKPESKATSGSGIRRKVTKEKAEVDTFE
jgi:hypothetical protein